MDQQFRAALGALFGHDAAQQQAANLWLNDFSKTPEAWGCALALLEPTSGATLEQAFFAANLLANKTREEWGRLSPQQRAELAEAFSSKLRGLLLPPGATPAAAAVAAAAAVPAVLLDRVALLAAAAAALGGPATADRHLALAFEAASVAGPALASGADKAGGAVLLRCALLMLQQLAEEAEGLDSGRRKALLAGTEPGAAGGGGGGGLVARQGGVVAVARQVLTTAAAGPAGGPPNFVLLTAAVRCLIAWVRLDESGHSGGGMSAGELEAVSPGLLPAALSLLALQPPGPPTSSPAAAAAAGASPAARQRPTATAIATATALFDAVSDLAGDVLGSGSRTCPEAAGGAAADVAAAASALTTLVGLGPRLSEAAAGGGGGGAAAAVAVAALLAWVRVAVAVAEHNPGRLVTEGEGAVALARGVVAALAACPGRRPVAEAVTDYLLALNTVPTAERHPALRAPLYGALLPYVLRAVAYPAGFTDWESEVEEDEEGFHRFREQQANDLLESMYGQCRTELVAQLVAAAVGGDVDVMASGGGGGGGAGGGVVVVSPPPGSGPGSGNGDWRGVEAALYCIRAVHMPVKAAALGGRAGELDAPEARTTAAELNALLERLFTDICLPSGRVARLLTVPWVCLAASRLIAEYAAWLGKAERAPLKEAMGLLLRALGVPPAASAAAQAFRNCCVRGGDRLTSDPFLLAELAAAAMAVVAPPPPPPSGGAAAAAAVVVPLGLEERCAVVEGLARLASRLPGEAAAEAGCGLMRPCVERARSVAAAAAAAGGPLSPATLSALAAELGLMTAVVRFLEPPSTSAAPLLPGAAGAAAGQQPPHPALRALEVAWPVLSAVVAEPQCRNDAGVVEALAELYKRSLLATRGGATGRPLLKPLLEGLMGLLATRPHAAALDCIATVVELYGMAAGCEDTRGLQVAALQGCVQMMAGLMAQQQQQASPAFPSSSSPGELAAAFFTLADRYLIFAQALLTEGEGSAALPALVEWACGVLTTMREREPTAAALSFLTHLLSAATQATVAAATAAPAGAGGGGGGGGGDTARMFDALFTASGPRLLHSLMVAGTDNLPRQLMRPLAGCLAGLMALAAAGGAGAGGAGASGVAGAGEEGGWSGVRRGLPGWLRGAWQLPPLADLINSGRLGEGGSHAARFTELLLRGGKYPAHPLALPPGLAAANGGGGGGGGGGGAPPAQSHSQPACPPPLPRGRLDALVSDLFALARGEAGADVMMAYEM